MGWVMVISMFIGKDLFDYDIMATGPITRGAGFFLVAGIIILLTILCAGYKLNTMNSPATWMVALFGAFTLLFGVFPFFGEAGAITGLSLITEDQLDNACQMMSGKLNILQG